MTATYPPTIDPWSAPSFPAAWYPDPWQVAPWRWWDGAHWTPILYGPYGEAWPRAVAGPPPFVPKGPGIKGGGIAAIGAGAGVVASVAVAIGFLIGSGGTLNGNDPWYLLASQFGLWAGVVGAVLAASRINGTKSLRRDFGLSWPHGNDLVLGIVGGLAARVVPSIFLVFVVLGGNGFSRPNAASPEVLGTTPSGITGWVIVIALAVVGAPLVEELFFRGLLQGAFTRRVGAAPALFITALIFSFAHVTNEGPFAPLILFPSAVLLGYLRLRSGRLAPGMVAHATFNASLFLLFLIPAFR